MKIFCTSLIRFLSVTFYKLLNLIRNGQLNCPNVGNLYNMTNKTKILEPNIVSIDVRWNHTQVRYLKVCKIETMKIYNVKDWTWTAWRMMMWIIIYNKRINCSTKRNATFQRLHKFWLNYFHLGYNGLEWNMLLWLNMPI